MALGEPLSDEEELSTITSASDYVEWGLARAGGAGRLQLLYVIALGWPWGFGAMLTYMGTFTGAATQQELVHCGPSAASAASAASRLLTEVADGAGAGCALAAVNCSLPRDAWRFVNPHTTYNAEFELVCERASLRPLLSTLFFFGYMIGVLVWGRLSDRLGRRFAFYTPLLFMLLGIAGTAVARDYSVFAAFRAVEGFGIAGFGLTAYVWCAEMLGPEVRSVMSWAPNVLWSLGQMLVSLVAYEVPGWRHLSWTIFAIGSMFVLYLPVVKESPLWLASKGRVDEAHEVLCHIARVNGNAPPPPPSALKAAAENEGEGEAASFGQIFDRRVFGRLLIMSFAWFATSMGYYGLSLNSQSMPLSIYWANVISGATCIPAYLAAGPMIQSKRIGRKGTVSLSFLATAACLVSSALLRGSPAALVVLYYAATSAISLSFAVIYVWGSELFPTTLRGTAMGIQSLSARVGAMLAPFVAVLGGEGNASLPLLVFALPCLLAGLACLLLPETLGRPLLGTLEDLDREALEGSDVYDSSSGSSE